MHRRLKFTIAGHWNFPSFATGTPPCPPWNPARAGWQFCRLFLL